MTDVARSELKTWAKEHIKGLETVLMPSFTPDLKGEYDKASEEFRKFAPMTGIFESQMMPTILLGSYHWLLLKYYQWSTGGNGGMIRHPFRLFGHQLMAIKMSLSSIGIMPREPDEEFFAGRMNYARMKK